MTKPVRVDSEAQDELHAAVAWYDANTDRAAVGDELLEEINGAIDHIREWPAAFALEPGVSFQLGVRRCLLRRFPYAVVFVELQEEIRIVAIAHLRRRPGYWRGRLPRH